MSLHERVFELILFRFYRHTFLVCCPSREAAQRS